MDRWRDLQMGKEVYNYIERETESHYKKERLNKDIQENKRYVGERKTVNLRETETDREVMRLEVEGQ